MQVILVVLGILIGVAVALQGPFNGLWAGRIGLFQTILINAVVVFMGACLVFLLSGARLRIDEFRLLTPTIIVGGLCGLGIIIGSAYVFPKQGAAVTLALMIVGQFITALLLDHYGLIGLQKHSICLTRVVAVCLILAGAVLFKLK